LFPNFRAPNPTAIVTGLGGMAYMIASLFYVLVCTAAIAYPFVHGFRSGAWSWALLLPALGAVALVTAVVATLALVLGARSWQRIA